MSAQRLPLGPLHALAWSFTAILFPLLAFSQEAPGEEPAEPGVVILDSGERVVVRGFAWKRGERRDYRIVLDHVPIGRQTYTFVRPMQHNGEVLLEYDMFQNLDVRALGTMGRRVTTGYLVLATDGKPHYYRYEEAFKKRVDYSVNRPVMAGTRYRVMEFFLQDNPPQFRQGKERRLSGNKRPLAISEPFHILSDFPFVGQLAIYLQFYIVELVEQGALPLAMLDPIQTPPIDYPFDHRELGRVEPNISRVMLRVKEGETTEEGDDEQISVEIEGLGFLATLTTDGKLLTLETGKGLTFQNTEE